MFGRMLDERLGKWHFWLLFVGFNLTFLPQHMLGLLGMVRRVYTYHQGGQWEAYNLISSIGSGVMGVATLVFLVNVWRTNVARKGVRAGNDPWLADTLEWYTSSPPPPHPGGMRTPRSPPSRWRRSRSLSPRASAASASSGGVGATTWRSRSRGSCRCC